VDYDQDYEWAQWNLAAKRRILIERPTGNAAVPGTLIAPYYVEHQQRTSNSAATLISSLASRNTHSDQSTVENGTALGDVDMEESSSDSLFHSLTKMNRQKNTDFDSLAWGDKRSMNAGGLEGVMRRNKSDHGGTVHRVEGLSPPKQKRNDGGKAEKVRT
jgi:hypothetical protein